MIAATWVSVTFPYNFAFNTVYESQKFHGLNFFFDLLFIVDIVISFFTSYMSNKGQEIFDSVEIRRNYMGTSMFLTDMLACFGI